MLSWCVEVKVQGPRDWACSSCVLASHWWSAQGHPPLGLRPPYPLYYLRSTEVPWKFETPPVCEYENARVPRCRG